MEVLILENNVKQEVKTAKKKIPQRKCLGCDQMTGKKGMLRIVKNKEGEVFLDLTGKKSGRGAYICKDLSCFNLARKKRRFEYSLKCKIPDEVFSRLEQEIISSSEKE